MRTICFINEKRVLSQISNAGDVLATRPVPQSLSVLFPDSQVYQNHVIRPDRLKMQVLKLDLFNIDPNSLVRWALI